MKKICVALCFIVLTCTLFFNVKAAETYKIEIEPKNPTISYGQKIQFTAKIYDPSGKLTDKEPDRWSLDSHSESVATIGDSGMLKLTANYQGIITVRAHYGSSVGEILVTCTHTLSDIDEIKFKDWVFYGENGFNVRLFYTVYNKHSSVSEEQLKRMTFAWTVEPADLGTISSDNKFFKPKKVGRGKIKVRIGSVEGSTEIVIMDNMLKKIELDKSSIDFRKFSYFVSESVFVEVTNKTSEKGEVFVHLPCEHNTCDEKDSHFLITVKPDLVTLEPDETAKIEFIIDPTKGDYLQFIANFNEKEIGGDAISCYELGPNPEVEGSLPDVEKFNEMVVFDNQLDFGILKLGQNKQLDFTVENKEYCSDLHLSITYNSNWFVLDKQTASIPIGEVAAFKINVYPEAFYANDMKMGGFLSLSFGGDNIMVLLKAASITSPKPGNWPMDGINQQNTYTLSEDYGPKTPKMVAYSEDFTYGQIFNGKRYSTFRTSSGIEIVCSEGSNNEQLWSKKYTIPGKVEAYAKTMLIGDKIYIISHGYILCALISNGNLVYLKKSDDIVFGFGTTNIFKDRIICTFEKTVRCISLTTGKKFWQYNMPLKDEKEKGWYFVPIRMVVTPDGKAIVSSDKINWKRIKKVVWDPVKQAFVERYEVIRDTEYGIIEAFNIMTGAKLWKYENQDDMEHTIFLENNSVFYSISQGSSKDGVEHQFLRHFNTASGKVIKQFDGYDPVVGPVAISGNYIAYCVGKATHLRTLDGKMIKEVEGVTIPVFAKSGKNLFLYTVGTKVFKYSTDGKIVSQSYEIGFDPVDMMVSCNMVFVWGQEGKKKSFFDKQDVKLTTIPTVRLYLPPGKEMRVAKQSDQPEKMNLPAPIGTINGTTYIPVKEIVEALGGEFNYNKSSQTATCKLGSNEVILTLNNINAKVNGKETQIDAKNSKAVPALVEENFMAPLRFVVTSLGCNLYYVNSLKSSIVTYFEK